MDERLESRLAALTAAASRFVAARNRRSPNYGWLTEAEKAGLSDLRFSLAELDREEAKQSKGRAA